MRYFIDTNILFDLFQTGRPSHSDSLQLVADGYAGRVELVAAPISIMTILYSLKRYGVPMKPVIDHLNLLIPHIEFSPVGVAELLTGMNSGWTDLQDAIHFRSALAAGRIDAIVSNDKDFKQQDRIPVITPKQAVRRLK